VHKGTLIKHPEGFGKLVLAYSAFPPGKQQCFPGKVEEQISIARRQSPGDSWSLSGRIHGISPTALPPQLRK